MAKCNYCRRYTVNGRCPSCNRMYGEPNKTYDYYGNEIKSSSPSSSSSTVYYTDHSFAKGFWLGILISFGAICVAKRVNRKMVSGAITGTVINGVAITQIAMMLLMLFFPQLRGIF